MTAEDNFKDLCDLTTSLMGLPKGSLSLKSRKREIQVCRTVASVIARKEAGIHQKIIAKVLKRDRSLIYHYEKNHKGNYSFWVAYRKCWNKVYSAYENIENSKNVFIDDKLLFEHLITEGVIESKVAQVVIEVKSRQSLCLIKTTYREFSECIENIKQAMVGYHYNVKIL
jgi:hypothetical protein